MEIKDIFCCFVEIFDICDFYVTNWFCHYLKSPFVFQTRVPRLSNSSPFPHFKEGKFKFKQMKEEVRSQNSSLEKTRLELTTILLEAHCEANIGKKLQKEVECRAHLEALEKLIRK